MINKNFKFLILFVYVAIFGLSCDDRGPSESADAEQITASKVDVYGNPVINIVELEQSYQAEFEAHATDENGVFVGQIPISFEIINDSPGYLSSGNVTTTDTTVAQNTFNIVPLNNLDSDGSFNFSDTSWVRAYLENQNEIADTMTFVFENGGIAADNEVLSDIIVESDQILIDEETLISVEMTGTINGLTGIPIEGQFIRFQSLMPEDSDGTMTFGQMDPEYVSTDSLGIASAIFRPINQTGFVKIIAEKATGDPLSTETFLQVSSGEAINLEIIIPSNNTLMVTGGGGNESVTISAEVKDGFGNYATDEYDVIFTVPCPYPIDGACPSGDGDFSNDIKLNGEISNGGIPTAVSRSVNGIANVTLNSGNRPGLVLVKAQLCNVEDMNDGVCDNVLYEAEKVAAAISTGPANYGQVVAGWTEADSTGGGVYSLPVTATFWDKWTNPISDSTSVYWYINPEYIASVDPESKVGNCGQNEPGQACTQAYYTSGDIFNQGQICAKVSGEDGNDVVACSGGARCEDLAEFDCIMSEDVGCVWNNEFDECYFLTSEAYCNTLFFESQCNGNNPNNPTGEAPYNCIWEPGAIAAIPDWQALVNDGASCHYAPLINALDEQPFSFDANGDGFSDSFTGEWEAAGIIAPDDPYCNTTANNAISYQEQSDECESKSICSWEFIAGDSTTEDGSIGSCFYNGVGGSGYYNPCVDCQVDIIPLSPTVTDYCQTDDEPFDILIRGRLSDSYGDEVQLGSLLLAVFDASAFNFVGSDCIDNDGDGECCADLDGDFECDNPFSSDELITIDDEMGYEFDPPIPASATQITDANGEAYWIVRLDNTNCQNTNPDDPDVFSCNNVFLRAYLLDPLYGESIDLNTTLFKNCQP
ncbi:MAG: hypothetical protein CL869_00585 [Cytophagia bacterium]|nr:hypothetical protein [Cytophagia bacterium]|tara:strand:+ start:10636 stop:13263 length:2628 start_codon:yes stop_codon:yes gene_type:complete